MMPKTAFVTGKKRFIRFLPTFDLKRMDIQPQKEIANDFLLREVMYVHESFVSCLWSC